LADQYLGRRHLLKFTLNLIYKNVLVRWLQRREAEVRVRTPLRAEVLAKLRMSGIGTQPAKAQISSPIVDQPDERSAKYFL